MNGYPGLAGLNATQLPTMPALANRFAPGGQGGFQGSVPPPQAQTPDAATMLAALSQQAPPAASPMGASPTGAPMPGAAPTAPGTPPNANFANMVTQFLAQLQKAHFAGQSQPQAQPPQGVTPTSATPPAAPVGVLPAGSPQVDSRFAGLLS